MVAKLAEMSVYPTNIADAVRGASSGQELPGANAVGTEARFDCGCYVRVFLNIDERTGMILDAGYVSNGCGFMVAAAEAISNWLGGELITDLHGFTVSSEIADLKRVADVHGRTTCVEAAHSAARAAFRNYRSQKIEEYLGEKALVCTCFGVGEETIVKFVEETRTASIEEVISNTRAGSGCGSCRMLIQEIVETRHT
jgi:NifU-like protein involved in Fe-S cluster formation/bacterioferritin-associated ferredoxin